MCLTTPRSAPRGTTLVELTVVIVLLGLILGGILSVVYRQQRFYRITSASSATRSQVRQAASILPAELRGVAPSAGDIIQAFDSALEFQSTIGSGVVCERGADWLALAPRRDGLVDALRGELVPPAEGDLARALVADDENPTGDRWPAFEVTGVADDPDACLTGPFVDPADAGRPRLRLSLGAALPHEVKAGTPVRITRPVRYSLYRSGDGLWYLGANEWSEDRWAGIQPVSGPYTGRGRDPRGVQFAYLDDTGGTLDEPVDASRVARIRLIVRGAAFPELATSLARGTEGGLADSAVVDVALRNRVPR